VRRHDFSWNAAAELAALPIAFHPATAWLRHRIRRSRELACDALVAGVLSSVTAALLLAAASVLAPSYAVAVEPGTGNRAVVGSWTGRVAQWAICPRWT
jgi:beta-lactamase regulating signal transducer with metallopeptidase domain